MVRMSDDTKMILEEIRSLRGEMKEMESSLRGEMKEMESSLREEMGTSMKEMENSLRQEIRDGDNAIRLILENEIRPQIRIVAESHLNLNRKLDEIKLELKRYELLPLRTTLLEQDVRELKKRLAISV